MKQKILHILPPGTIVQALVPGSLKVAEGHEFGVVKNSYIELPISPVDEYEPLLYYVVEWADGFEQHCSYKNIRRK